MSNSILAAAAASAVANGALILSILGGSAYIASCERWATGPGQCDDQWDKGLLIMGIGTGVKGAWSVGFNTENTNISRSGAPAPSAPASPTAVIRRKVEDLAVDAAADQVKAILARGGRTDG
jgi:hypothetical protein